MLHLPLVILSLSPGLLPADRTVVLLVDNGSVRPAATLALRACASQLGSMLPWRVEPASLRYSDRIPASALGGTCARTLGPTLVELAAAATRHVLLVPLFLGPSGALQSGVEKGVEALRAARLELDIRVGPCLVDAQQPDDDRVARALASHVLAVSSSRKLQHPLKVALVDHGTPSVLVNAVRARLASELELLLAPQAAVVAACSMERREGAAYDFNEPLLERLLGGGPPFDEGDVVVAMAFLLPGRHAAAEGGDVANILHAAEATCPGLRTHVTPLLASHPLVLEVLRDRALAAASAVEAPPAAAAP